MEITKGSDLILILNLEDFKGEKMRVADCADFRLFVWTANRNNFLQFAKRDITQEGKVDKIAIPDYFMNSLESGVVCYTYSYSKYDENFEISDNYYDKVKVVVTDLYWRNANLNELPANPINYQTLNYLRSLIEREALNRESEIKKLTDFVNTDFMNKLQEEIKRSNEVDVEFHKIIKQNAADCQTRDAELDAKIDAEIKRSNEVDVQIFEMIRGNADSGKETTDNLNDKLDAEIARSSQADADLTNAVNNEVSRATNAETNLDTKIEGEKERAKTAEGAIRDAVENERDRAIAKETLINDTLTSEVARAKQVEADITTSLQSLKTSVDAEKQRSADKDTEHANAIAAEVARATAKENEIAANLATEISRATDREQHIDDDLHAEIERAKAEEKRIEDLIKTNADGNTAALDSLNDKADAIDAKADKIASDLQAEIDRATAAEKANADAITAASNALNDIAADNLKTAKDYTDAEVKKVNDALDAEVVRAKAAEKANADAIAVINGDETVIGSIAHSLADGKHYTNDEIAKAKAELNAGVTATLNDYATKKNVDDRIKEVIGTAPEALDTLGEIANVLNGNGDAIAAINEVLQGKASKADVDTLDGKVTATNAEVAANKTAIADETARAKAKESEIETALNAEIIRAKAAEKVNSDALAVVNGNEATIGSIAHGVADAKHYTDDEIAKLTAKVSADAANYATKADVAAVDTKVAGVDTKVDSLKTQIDNLDLNVDLSGYYNKTQVDKLIADIDVTDQLKDYAKRAEVSAIKDDKGNVITELVLDNSAADDTVEVYTKEQCDAKFALKGESGSGLQVWSGSQAEFDAIAVKDNNTLYLIK